MKGVDSKIIDRKLDRIERRISEKGGWDDLPTGVIGWVLWSLPGRVWKLVVWGIALFIAVTAAIASYQLWKLRVGEDAKLELEQKKLRSEFYEEQWKRSDKPSWKLALLETWTKPREIPDSMWAEATKHSDVDVRSAVALHPETPLKFLEKLIDDEPRVQLPASYKYWKKIGQPIRFLDQFKTEENPAIRKRIISFPSVPDYLLSLMSSDPDPDVRIIVARSENAPDEVLMSLAKDPKLGIRLAVAKNKKTSREILITLASDINSGVHETIARDTKAPPEALKILSLSRDSRIREAVAANSNTPPGTLIKMLFSSDGKSRDDVRWFIAGNSNAPAKALIELSYDNDIEVRERVASNPSAPIKSLIKLASDTHDVLLALANNIW